MVVLTTAGDMVGGQVFFLEGRSYTADPFSTEYLILILEVWPAIRTGQIFRVERKNAVSCVFLGGGFGIGDE
jgi:hypothetical protein